MLHNLQKIIIAFLILALFANFIGYFHWWYLQDQFGPWSESIAQILRVLNPAKIKTEPAFRPSGFHLSETIIIFSCFVMSALLSFISMLLAVAHRFRCGRYNLFAALFTSSITLFCNAIYTIHKTSF